LASLILVVNVVGELQQKRTLAASRGFLAAARLSCIYSLCRLVPEIIAICDQIRKLWKNRAEFWTFFALPKFVGTTFPKVVLTLSPLPRGTLPGKVS